MPAYALYTDPARYGFPAWYAILRYPSERARAAALKRFSDGQDAARRILAEGHIIPACLPTPFETVEPVAESVEFIARNEARTVEFKALLMQVIT